MERYYNTINKEIDKDGIKREEIFIVYLTLGGKPPSAESLGTLNLKDVHCIDYTQGIAAWLMSCIHKTETKNNLLSKIILQYRELIEKLTSDVEQAELNLKKISENIDNAWGLEKENKFFTKEYFEIFKHVRWHTVANFVNELENALIEKEALEIKKPDLNTITSITHNNNNNKKLIVKFEYKGTLLQIVNDAKGFTLGNLTDKKKWDYFSEEIKTIRFYDFANEETFRIINNDYRTTVIDKMINQIETHHKESYKKLKGKFKQL